MKVFYAFDSLCMNSWRQSKQLVLPVQLKALGTSCSYEDLQRWRSQEPLAVVFLVLCGASMIAASLWLLHLDALFSSMALDTKAQMLAGDSVRALQRLMPSGSSRLWVAVAASLADVRKALCSRLSWMC